MTDGLAIVPSTDLNISQSQQSFDPFIEEYGGKDGVVE